MTGFNHWYKLFLAYSVTKVENKHYKHGSGWEEREMKGQGKGEPKWWLYEKALWKPLSCHPRKKM